MNSNHEQVGVLSWQLTPWVMNGKGGWTQQPVILVEGQTPFFADHPQAYIDKLQEMHNDPTVARGSFYTCIGQLQDALEQAWNIKEKVLWHAKHS